MVDECKGTYYMLEIKKIDEDGVLEHTQSDLHLIGERSCADGECSECDRMRLMEQVNDYDYSFRSRMDKMVNGGIYKLGYEDEDGDRHMTELVFVTFFG